MPDLSHDTPHVAISCGEASGDRYGAALARALKQRRPELKLTGLGGPGLAEAGVDLVARSDDVAVMGVSDVIAALPRILGVRRRLREHLTGDDRPDLFVPVDFPGFNLDLAVWSRKRGLPVYYVVAPMLWAWGAWRLGKVRRAMDALCVLLPFEQEWFASRGVPSAHFGHPLCDDYEPEAMDAAAIAREARLRDPSAPLRLGLLPGSRRQEVLGLAPLLAETVARLRAAEPRRTFQAVASVAPGVDPDWLRPLWDVGCEPGREPLPELLPGLDLAIVCSGTASLEANLAAVPHALVYRTSSLNYALGRLLVRVPHIGLGSLVLGREMVREHLQGEATPDAVLADLRDWLGNTARRRRHAEHLDRLRALLGPPGCWDRTADAVLDLLEETRHG